MFAGVSAERPAGCRTGRAWWSRTTALAVLASSGLVVGVSPSVAEASLEWPSATITHPETVSADMLPTVQINGVVWAQEIVGNTVYVGGNFTQARPAGSPAGQNQTARSNFLAYNLTTGALLTTVNFPANAQVRTIEKSPDGSRIYIGGDFTSFGGVSRSRIAAINTANNTLVTTFAPSIGYHVYDIDVTADTVYAAGNFTNVGAQTRQRLAAFNLSGGLLSWAPSVPDRQVWAIEVSPDGQKVAIGGQFETVNGTTSFGRGLAMLSASTGALLPFPAASIVRNGGPDGAITALASDGELLYGSGYTFGRAAGTLEGQFAAQWSDGATRWINDCHGDTYALHVEAQAIYSAGHAHYCGNVGGFGQPNEWAFFRGIAVSKEVAGTVARERLGYTSFAGQPRPDLLNFFPSLNAGTFTGQSQGPWHVEGNGQYVVFGGEFTNVNGTAQQGLVRFRSRDAATNDRGPQLFNATYPIRVRSLSPGEATITFPANRDQDDADLTYNVYRRTGGTGNGTLRHTRAFTTPFWNLPNMTWTDTGMTPGTAYQYRVQVTDGWGNFANSPWTDVTIGASETLTPYVDAVLASEPDSFWQLGEASGTATADFVGTRDGTANNVGVVLGQPGGTGGGTSAQFLGTTGSFVRTPLLEYPSHVLSVEAWFRAGATANGGLIAGFNNSNTSGSGAGSTSSHDRVVYMDTGGRIHFGVNAVDPVTVTGTTNYRDDNWHHVVGTLGPDGMQLFVDGNLVGQRTDTTNARTGYYGYWRIGGGALNGFPSTNTSTARWFDGFIDDVAVYKKVLTATEVVSHFAAAGFDPPNVAPVADFTAGVTGQSVDFDGTASDDVDGTVVNWAWDFGDGSAIVSGNDPTVNHVYGSVSTFNVTLTVTDNEGTTHSVTKPVTTTAPNQQPVAAFDITIFGNDVTLDGSDSTDPGGSIVSYSYNWGDGSPNTTSANPVANHTYATTGEHTAVLTVTDNQGSTAQRSHTFITNAVPAPPNNPAAVLAADAFGRTVASGLGSADTGGAWTLSGQATNYNVAGGVATLRMGAAGAGLNPYLGSVSSTNSDTRLDFTLDKPATGGGTYVTAIGRRVGTTVDYRATVRYQSNGTVMALIVRRNGTTDTNLAVLNTIPGLNPAPGQMLSMRFQALGTGTTNLALKVWVAGQPEPAGWLLTAADTNAALQTAGNVGVSVYLSGSASNAPVVATIDNLSSTDPTASANLVPTARFTTFIDGSSTSFDASASSDDGPISYSWTFGDGGTSNAGPVVPHQYAAPGDYLVTLTVTDGANQQHQMSATVRIEP